MERSFVINARGKLGLAKATEKAEPYAVTLFEWRKK
jgi:hypothetical protein